MRVNRIKLLARVFGVAAIGIAIAVNVGIAHAPPASAGGSGDSSTTGQYTSPEVTAMKLNPTNMNLGSTATFTAPATTLAAAEASPTLKATPAPECVNNGQCP